MQALLHQSHKLDAIYIVDCASTDDTQEVIHRIFGPAVNYRRLPENAGASGGFERGLRWATHGPFDWLWLTDNDSIPSENALSELLAHAYDDVVALAPRKLTSSGIQWIGEAIEESSGREVQLSHPPPSMYEKSYFACAWAANTGLLLKAEAIKQAGFPMPELWSWGEDAELCTRLRNYGRILLVPSSIVTHPNPTLPWPAPITSLWKVYYRHRNLNFLQLRGLLPPKITMLSLLWQSTKASGVIFLRLDHKLRRIAVMVAATWHAICGRLGRAPRWIHD